jgi:hypothetical protein
MISIFIFIFIIVFYTTIGTKIDLTYIYFKDFFTDINYTHILTEFDITCSNIITATHGLIYNIKARCILSSKLCYMKYSKISYS